MRGKRRQTSARSSPPAVQATVIPVIDAFTGPYFFLSNFAESPVDFEGAVYPTVEHAFAAAKTLDRTERELIRLAERPGEAKRLGRQVALRPGWDDLRVEVMRGLLARKFAPGTDLAARLLATGDAQLVEGNTWGTASGACVGVRAVISLASCSWNGVTSYDADALPSSRLAEPMAAGAAFRA
jgi:ribA/ribD-fused uncharacterized protein